MKVQPEHRDQNLVCWPQPHCLMSRGRSAHMIFQQMKLLQKNQSFAYQAPCGLSLSLGTWLKSHNARRRTLPSVPLTSEHPDEASAPGPSSTLELLEGHIPRDWAVLGCCLDLLLSSCSLENPPPGVASVQGQMDPVLHAPDLTCQRSQGTTSVHGFRAPNPKAPKLRKMP